MNLTKTWREARRRVLGVSYAGDRARTVIFEFPARMLDDHDRKRMRATLAKSVLVLACAAVPAIARADPETIALDEVVRITVARNPGLTARRVDAAIEDDRVTSARGAQDWLLALGAKWNTSRPKRPLGNSMVDPETTSVTASTSVTRPLPGGGSIGLSADASFSRQRFVLDDATSKISANIADVLVVLHQPLLRGWRGDSAPHTLVARAQASRDIAYLEAARAAAAAIRDVVRAYWELGFARDDLAIRRMSLSLAQEQLRITRARVSSGRIAMSETLAVGQAIALREDEVAQSEANLVARSLDLAQRLGREVTGPLTFEPIDRPAPSRERRLDRELAAALAQSPDLAIVRARGKAAAIEVDVTENGALPALDLNATGGVHGAATDARQVWRELSRADDVVVSAEIRLTVPLGNRAASGALGAAKRTVRRVKLDEQALIVEIRRAVVDAATAMQAARHRIAVLQEAVQLADQAIDAERARWEEGRSTNYDVMKRQAEREDSALRRARAQADLLEAEATLDALTGAILPRYGVGLAR